MRQLSSLHSLLEALPAASVDTGEADDNDKQRSLLLKKKRASVSSLSLESRTSDFDSYFYI